MIKGGVVDKVIMNFGDCVQISGKGFGGEGGFVVRPLLPCLGIVYA